MEVGEGVVVLDFVWGDFGLCVDIVSMVCGFVCGNLRLLGGRFGIGEVDDIECGWICFGDIEIIVVLVGIDGDVCMSVVCDRFDCKSLVIGYVVEKEFFSVVCNDWVDGFVLVKFNVGYMG